MLILNTSINRDSNGIVHIHSDKEASAYQALGYVHAMDRGLQMSLMRILGQGRISEILDSSEKNLKIDHFFRKMNWSSYNFSDYNKNVPQYTKDLLKFYCDGVNEGFQKNFHWEFSLLGYTPEEWKVEDVILLFRMLGYLTLAQSQGEMEKLLIELVQSGVSKEYLEELFPSILDGLDIELLKKVCLQETIIPSGILWEICNPTMMASNNWVVSGVKTKSGSPILCNDPHLEVNRLPAIWYPVSIEVENNFLLGGTIPGLPAVLIGRNKHVSWGVTYSFMDCIDSWVENCKDGKYYREGSGWISFKERKEKIKRKFKNPVDIIFYENDHGVLDGNPYKDGFYLTSLWTGSQSGIKTLLEASKLLGVTSARDAMDVLGKIETSWNFVVADIDGNIGYQMSGLMPVRKDNNSGFVALPGWKSENDWNGFMNYKDLPREYNPHRGYIVTANNDLNHFSRFKPINMPMGSYRAERISNLLDKSTLLDTDSMMHFQYDLYSIQAKRFMDIVRPLLPFTENGNILKEWDCKYEPDSKGAYLFELFYKHLYMEVFGKKGIGTEIIKYLEKQTGIFIDFYANFDRLLLSEKSLWFGESSREDLYRIAIGKALMQNALPWKEAQKIQLKHILFGDTFLSALGFNYGPIHLKGSRATINQGQVYNSNGRVTSFGPSIRIICDMADNSIYLNLAGGISDRKLSKWYTSGIKDWYSGVYYFVHSKEYNLEERIF